MTIAPIIDKGRAAEILLVEDNRGDAVLLARAFKEARLPCNISVAQSAEQALKMLRRQGEYIKSALPDLVILDLNLPQMGGHEFLSTVKSDKSIAHLPVIVLSSSHAAQDVVASYALQAAGYIVKPVALEKFREMVAAIEEFFFVLIVRPESAEFGQGA